MTKYIFAMLLITILFGFLTLTAFLVVNAFKLSMFLPFCLLGCTALCVVISLVLMIIDVLKND